MSRVKLIIFDAGDVLFDSGMRRFNKVYYNFLKKHNKEHLFDKSGLLWDDISEKARSGEITQLEANRRIFSTIGIHPRHVRDILAEDKKLLKKIKLYKGVLNVLKSLRKSCYKLAILTDVVWPRRLLKQLFGRLRLFTYTDSIFFSNVIGYAKPHRKSYLTVMNRFHVSPLETVFVGHSKDEISGARKLGIITVKLGNEKAKTDYKINLLTELPKIMNKMSKEK